MCGRTKRAHTHTALPPPPSLIGLYDPVCPEPLDRFWGGSHLRGVKGSTRRTYSLLVSLCLCFGGESLCRWWGFCLSTTVPVSRGKSTISPEGCRCLWVSFWKCVPFCRGWCGRRSGRVSGVVVVPGEESIPTAEVVHRFPPPRSMCTGDVGRHSYHPAKMRAQPIPPRYAFRTPVTEYSLLRTFRDVRDGASPVEGVARVGFCTCPSGPG